MEGHTAATASDGPETPSDTSDPTSDLLLDVPHGARARSAEQGGKPHPPGIRLNVGIRFLPPAPDVSSYPKHDQDR